MKRLICLLLSFIIFVSALGIYAVKPARSATFTSTFKSEAAIDGYISKWGRPYPPSQHTDISTSLDLVVGQWRDRDTTQPGYIYCIQRAYISFDTSAIPENSQINSVTLGLKTKSDYSTTDFGVKVWYGDHDICVWNAHKGIYGLSLDASDWNNGTAQAATWNTANYPGNNVYIALQIPVEAVDKDGRTQFMLNSTREGTSPTGDELVYFYSGDSVGNEPILEISYTEGTTLWNVPWGSVPSDYANAPINLSSTFTFHGLNPGYEMSAQLVVSVYQYQREFTNPYEVLFRTALKFDSYVPKGSFDERENLRSFQASYIDFFIEKDTQGVGLDKQCIHLITNDQMPGYSQGYGLQQSTKIDSTSDFRGWWGYKAIKFCAGLVSQPIGIAWGLIDIATSFSPKSIDFNDAGYADSMAISWWNDNNGYLGPVYNPIRQYCLNSWKWTQDAINPQSYYGLKVYARICLDPDINKWGNNYDPGQFPFGYIDTPPVYLRIGHSHSLAISSDSQGNTNPAPGTYHYFDGQSVSVTALPYSGYQFAYWTLDGNTAYSNPIQVTMNTDHILAAHFRSASGGGGGGCPTLFVWNGNGYVDYGVINIHNPTGEDVIREVPIQSEDVCINSHKAKFRLREGWEGLNFSESVTDQVKLYAVNSQGNRYLCPLISAKHSRLGNVLPQLLLSDDYRAQMLLLETVDLTFVVPCQNIQGFTFVIEGCNFYKV